MDPSSQNFIELSCTDEDSTRTYRIDPDKIESLTKYICRGLGVEAYELSWDFVDDDEMRTLNRQYRDKDRSTDVLSFPQQEWESPRLFTPPADAEGDTAAIDGPPEMLGDVVISPSMALHNARNIGHELDREVCFLLVHGILHLCGHDHEDANEEEAMTREQQSIMKSLETAGNRPLWIDCAKVGV